MTLRQIPAVRTALRLLSRYTQRLTPLGRGVLAAGLLSWLLGWRLGWQELFLAAATCFIALLVGLLFTLGGANLSVELEVDPSRVFVGTPAAGRVIVTNTSRQRLLPLRVDLPVGQAVAEFNIPSLGQGQVHDDLFVVPTHRRAVIDLGPASSVRGDPLGLLRREAVSGQTEEVFVHPTVVQLGNLGAGLLRDLEGQTTRDNSNSDLAFHTLREYVEGDDRRYVHWRSSAKAGRLLVRQFLDTRRSRLTVVIDSSVHSYRTDEEFEIAVSVAASLGLRALREDIDLTVVAADHAVSNTGAQRLLDTLSRVSPDQAPTSDLSALVVRASRLATDTSVAILITGSVIPFADLHAATLFLGPDVRPMAIRVETDAPTGIGRSGGLTVLGVRRLRDLPPLLASAVGT